MSNSSPPAPNRRTIRLIVIITGVGIVLLFAGISWFGARPTGREVVFNGISVPPIPTLNVDRVAQGDLLYQQFCASCHGANLEGAPSWKQPLEDGSLPPPPHDSSGHTWHHEDSLLLSITVEGSAEMYGGTMPGFGDQLSQDELIAILDYIMSKWGEEERAYQWWITARPNNFDTMP